jgi:single-strand DNA-binding protein
MYNKVIMVGNLTRDIELRYLPSGSAIAKSAIATSYKYKTQTGEPKEEVCFLEFTVFGKGAEILNQYVRKGSKVLLEGRLIFEQWQTNDGNNRNRHTLRVDEFKFLDSKADSMNQNSGMQGGGYNQPQMQQNMQKNNNYNQPQMQNNDYNTQTQTEYNQSRQNNDYNSQPQYQTNANIGQQPMQSTQQPSGGSTASQEDNIPDIDIDNDEIPF